MDDSNPYDAPATPDFQPTGELTPTPPIRATIAAFLAPIALAGFVLNDPWAIRDGIWLQHLVNALPWFIGAFGLPVYAMLIRHRSRTALWVSIVTLAVLACLPLTWRYVERVFTQLMPFS